MTLPSLNMLYVKIGAAVVVLLVLLFGAYQFDKALAEAKAAAGKIQEADDKAKVAEANRAGVVTALEEVSKQLVELKANNEKLEASVATSKQNVARLQGQLTEARKRLQNADIGSTCEENLDWLRNYTEELKKEFAQ